MKLTEDNFRIQKKHPLGGELIISNWSIHDYMSLNECKQLKKQILDDHEKADYMDVMVKRPWFIEITAKGSERYDSIKEKAENWDELPNYYHHTWKIYKENKQLQEQVSRELEDNNELRKTSIEYLKLKEKLEKIKKWIQFTNRPVPKGLDPFYYMSNKFTELEEILEAKDE